MIFGLSGKAGTGKTTFADLAVAEFGFKKMSFATGVKEEAAEFLTKLGVKFEDRNLYGSQSDKEERLRIPIKNLGTSKEDKLFLESYSCSAKDLDRETGVLYTTFREFLQFWGTEFRRKNFGEGYWVKRLMDKISPKDNVVIDDVRFPNESDAIIVKGGYMIRIIRPDRPKTSNPGHPSEVALDTHAPHSFINNTASLGEFQDNCLVVIERYLFGGERV